jgi:Methyladenine glycosylase
VKIKAAVCNAQAFLAIQEELGGFDAYCWRFVDGRPKLNRWRQCGRFRRSPVESDAFSKDLKRRVFSFVGSTVIYAHMQAVGMVNDHPSTVFDMERFGGSILSSSVSTCGHRPATAVHKYPERCYLQGWACFFKQDHSSMNSIECPIVALTYPMSYLSAVTRMVGAVVNWFTALVAGSEAPLACRDPTL